MTSNLRADCQLTFCRIILSHSVWWHAFNFGRRLRAGLGCLLVMAALGLFLLQVKVIQVLLTSAAGNATSKGKRSSFFLIFIHLYFFRLKLLFREVLNVSSVLLARTLGRTVYSAVYTVPLSQECSLSLRTLWHLFVCVCGAFAASLREGRDMLCLSEHCQWSRWHSSGILNGSCVCIHTYMKTQHHRLVRLLPFFGWDSTI